MSNLTVSVHDIKGGGLVVVELAGEAWGGQLDVLERALRRASSLNPSVVVLDLSRLDAASSLAMASLVAFHVGVRKHGGEVRIANPSPAVAEAFRQAGLDAVFEVHLSVESAVLGMAALAFTAG